MNEQIQTKLNEVDGLSQYYRELLNSLKAKHEAGKYVKEQETKLKEDIAMKSGSYKKDGTTPDTSIVKMTSLNGAIAVHYNEADKLQEAADLKEEYLSEIRQGDISQSQVDTLVTKRATLKEATSGVKATREGMKTKVDSDIVEALFLIAQEEMALIKDNEDAEDGKEKKKTKKTANSEEVFNLVKAIKESLGKS